MTQRKFPLFQDKLEVQKTPTGKDYHVQEGYLPMLEKNNQRLKSLIQYEHDFLQNTAEANWKMQIPRSTQSH